MYENLINILNVANNINKNDDLNKIKNDFIILINEQQNSNLYKLIIYAVDDKMISIFGYQWLEYLLEKQYLQTDIGGNLFYDYIRQYIINKDFVLLYASAIILKNGFKGCYKIWPMDIYNEIINILHLNKQKIISLYESYIPHIQYNKLISWWWLILPMILTYIVIQIINFVILLIVNKLLSGVA